MNPFDRVTLASLRERTSAKWRTYPTDVLPLWVAEMDVFPAEPVVAAIHDALAMGDTGYPSGTGYAEALADFASARWAWDGIDPSRTAVVADVMTGIAEVLALVTAPDDAVVVNCPVYPPFYAFVERSGRRVVEAPLTAAGRLDFDAMAGAFADATSGGRAAAYLLCNPHNPTGTVHTTAELERAAALAAEYRVRVVVDEIHSPLVLAGARFTPYLSVPGGEAGFSVMSASKGWNLAGLKAAVVVAGAAASDDLARLPEIVGHGPSHLAAVAHTAALRSGGAWLDDLLDALDANRTLVTSLIASHLPAARFTPPEATFLAWIDCRELRLGLDEMTDDAAPRYGGGTPSSAAAPATEPTAEPAGERAAEEQRGDVTALAGPAAEFLERGRVALSSGHVFGTGGDGFVRLNFATRPDILEEAFRRLGDVANSSPSR